MEEVEKKQEEIIQAMADVQDNIKCQEEAMNFYMDQLDDFENRERRQNICIHSLPEAYHTSNLIVTVQGLFQQILGGQSKKLWKWAEYIMFHSMYRPNIIRMDQEI